MKRNLFKLMMLVGLIALANTTFAAGTYAAPEVTENYVYTVGSLVDTDTYQFYLLAAGEDPYNGGATTDMSAGYTVVTTTYTGGLTGTVGAGGNATTTANIEITWDEPDTYLLWIEVTDATGPSTCKNYRFLTITVTYTVDFAVIALSESGDENTGDITAIGGATQASNVCASFVGENFETGTDNQGNTYVYFKVTRTPNVSYNNDWTITTSSVTGSVTWAYSATGDGTDWVTEALAAKSVASGVDVVYYRATVANAIASHTVQLAIGVTSTSSTGSDLTPTKTDIDNDDVVAVVTIDALPAVGGFSGL